MFFSPFSYIKGSLNISVHLFMEIILVDPNLGRTFFGNNFFDPNYGAHPWKNYFLVRTKLGYLRYMIICPLWKMLLAFSLDLSVCFENFFEKVFYMADMTRLLSCQIYKCVLLTFCIHVCNLSSAWPCVRSAFREPVPT